MTLSRRLQCALMVVAACWLAPAARGQPAFDVPYVPTPYVVVEEMLRLAANVPGEGVEDAQARDVEHTSSISMDPHEDWHWTYESIGCTVLP